jgi:hypothetical protein
MGIGASKSGKVMKVAGIAVLLFISILGSIQVGSSGLKNKSFITCEGDTTDRIIVTQERQRNRVFWDTFKKVMIVMNPILSACDSFRPLNAFEIKSLFMNAYQRNVFYVFAFSTVP